MATKLASLRSLVPAKAVSIVDSLSSLVSLLDDVNNIKTELTIPPSVYMDAPGINLSHHSSISMLQIYYLPHDHVYLIDIFVLGETALNMPSQSGMTLRWILESARIPKAVFDLRNAAQALYNNYDIKIQGVHDIQLLEVATRSGAKDLLMDLEHCIEHDARLSAAVRRQWKATITKGATLFEVEQGGSSEALSTRPLPQDLVDLCAQSVVHLPRLWNLYMGKMTKRWLDKVRHETEKRILRSQAQPYDAHGKDKDLSPWAKAVDDTEKQDHHGSAEQLLAIRTESRGSGQARESMGAQMNSRVTDVALESSSSPTALPLRGKNQAHENHGETDS